MLFDYAGAFHIHSEYSFDGNTKVKDIISAAKRKRLDFIVITDHFILDARANGWEGWHDGVLVLVGEEISPRYNHYIALDIEKPVIAWKKSSKPQDYIDAVNEQSGFGLIAHPDHKGAPKFGVKNYPWKDWAVKGYTGISIWDLMTDWQEKLGSRIKALWSYFAATWCLTGPKKETLERWDALNAKKRIVGYGEIDNHNSKKLFLGIAFRIFPFDYAFSTIRTHVLLTEELSKDFQKAKTQIFHALKQCRAYVAQERWNNAKGFSFRAFCDERNADIGDEFKIDSKPVKFEVRLPRYKEGRIRFICNGKIVAEQKGQLNIEAKQPGVYRVEVNQRICGIYKPWIYSNPIWFT